MLKFFLALNVFGEGEGVKLSDLRVIDTLL